MGLRHTGVVGRQSTGERRVRVAVDEYDLGLALGDRGPDARPHRGRLSRVEVEPVIGLWEAELVEEDLGELTVVVLPRVEHDLVDPALAQSDRQGGGFDELRPASDDREDSNDGGTLGAASSR